MTLVWLTSIVFQKKKKVDCSSTKPIVGSENDVKNVDSSWRKCLHLFNLFWSKLFRKNELWFSFFIRTMKSIFSSLLLCIWQTPCCGRNQKFVVCWNSEKKSIFVSKLFQKNELLFSFFVRIMRAIISSLLLCFWKRPCLKRKKSVDSILRFWKKSLLFHFFSNFFFEKMTYDF